jgi:hypothetical protein
VNAACESVQAGHEVRISRKIGLHHAAGRTAPVDARTQQFETFQIKVACYGSGICLTPSLLINQRLVDADESYGQTTSAQNR